MPNITRWRKLARLCCPVFNLPTEKFILLSVSDRFPTRPREHGINLCQKLEIGFSLSVK